jgi:hypothetical protein
MRIGNDNFITEGTPTDLSSSFTSTPVLLAHIVNYSIQLVFDGTLDGIFSLQVSNDEGQISQAPAIDYQGVNNWTDVTGSSQIIAEGGDHTWEVSNSGTRWVRFVWTTTGSTGTLTSAIFNVKGA